MQLIENLINFRDTGINIGKSILTNLNVHPDTLHLGLSMAMALAIWSGTLIYIIKRNKK